LLDVPLFHSLAITGSSISTMAREPMRFSKRSSVETQPFRLTLAKVVTTASSSGNAFSVSSGRGRFSSPRGQRSSLQKLRK
jgi:hypothetical protein